MKLKKFNYLDILIDNSDSWMWIYIPNLTNILKKYSSNVRIFKQANDIKVGDVLFILSCDRILQKDVLNKHINNIVIHESDLPIGKGWSPLSYQVEEGKEEIPITLFEAEETLDSGKWYLKDYITLDGTELIDELRLKQAIKSFEMIDMFLKQFPCKSYIQNGKETIYPKRTSNNQIIDVNKSILEQFNKLRVSDNNRYPAHFFIKGQKYILKIEKESK